MQSSSSCGDVFLPSENGLLAFALPPAKDAQDPELINAGKEFVTMLTGGCVFHHGDSFAMMRGGHLDLCVVVAFQIAENGDLANWHTGAADAIPAVERKGYGLGFESLQVMTDARLIDATTQVED